MAKAHSMTPARRAALKRAQAASARKRRGKGRGKLAAANRKYDGRSKKSRRGLKVAGTVAAGAAVGYTVYKLNGKRKKVSASKATKAKDLQQRKDHARTLMRAGKDFPSPYTLTNASYGRLTLRSLTRRSRKR